MHPRSPSPDSDSPRGSNLRAAMFILVGFATLALIAFALFAGLRWLGPTRTLMNTTAGSPESPRENAAPSPRAPTP